MKKRFIIICTMCIMFVCAICSAHNDRFVSLTTTLTLSQFVKSYNINAQKFVNDGLFDARVYDTLIYKTDIVNKKIHMKETQGEYVIMAIFYNNAEYIMCVACKVNNPSKNDIAVIAECLGNAIANGYDADDSNYNNMLKCAIDDTLNSDNLSGRYFYNNRNYYFKLDTDIQNENCYIISLSAMN